MIPASGPVALPQHSHCTSAVGYATQLHYWTQATGQLASKTLLPSGQKGQKEWLSHSMALPHKWHRWPELTFHWPKQIIQLEVNGARIHILLFHRQEWRIKQPMMGGLQHSSECSWLTKEDIENISNPSIFPNLWLLLNCDRVFWREITPFHIIIPYQTRSTQDAEWNKNSPEKFEETNFSFCGYMSNNFFPPSIISFHMKENELKKLQCGRLHFTLQLVNSSWDPCDTLLCQVEGDRLG